MAYNSRVDTFINVKIRFEGQTHRFKLPLRELAPLTLQDKLCQLLGIPHQTKAIFERYSDSTRTYVVLDPNNVSTYKQLHRAARAKLRLRLRASIIHTEKDEDIKENHAKDDKNTVPVAVPRSTTSNHTLPTLRPTSSSVSECPYKSNIINSINDIQQCLQKFHLNDYVSSTATTDQTTVISDERQSKVSTAISEPELALKIECPHTSNTQDDNLVSSIPKKCITDQRTCEDFENKKTSLSSFSELYTLTVICNSCNSLISGEHYHCSNCEGGDFDLCQKCVDSGTLCHSEDHWLIRRFIKNGKPVNSITQTITSKSPFQSKQTKDISQNAGISVATRTCNCCIIELTEENFVTCTTCPDYDLCVSCHVGLNHGHHPGHAFEPVNKNRRLDTIAQSLLAPGRNIEHNATCDGCYKVIYGIRHKCLDCPDWDFCSFCNSSAKKSHPKHRFVPIYEKFDHNLELEHLCPYKASRHFGVFCDGPFCKNVSSYITGDRYKCAICDDTDFCARCEASTKNMHNPNHPLIKLKVPIHNVSVETYNHGHCNESVLNSGDKQLIHCPMSKETRSDTSKNAEIKVQTIFDLNPTEASKAKQEDKTDLSPCKIEEVSALSLESKPVLVAHFIRDIITDGTIMLPNLEFNQTWYLRNAGELSWPSGCYVKFVSGTKMFHENKCSESTLDLKSTSRSPLCDKEVPPGKTVGFTVSLKTPRSPGNYKSFWRLATANGNLVGPKLWCEINVEEQVPVIKEESKEAISVEGSNMIFPKLEKETTFPRDDQEQTSFFAAAEEELCEFSEGNLSDEDLLDFSVTDDEYVFLDASDEECIVQQQKSK